MWGFQMAHRKDPSAIQKPNTPEQSANLRRQEEERRGRTTTPTTRTQPRETSTPSTSQTPSQSGGINQEQLNQLVSERGGEQQQQQQTQLSPQEEIEKQSFIDSIAKVGLEIPAFLTNVLLAGGEFITGQEQGSLGRSSPEGILERHPDFGRAAGTFITLGSTAITGLGAFNALRGVGGAAATVNIAQKAKTAKAITKVSKTGKRLRNGNLEDIVTNGGAEGRAASGGRVGRVGRVTTNTKTAKLGLSKLKKVTKGLLYGSLVLGTLSGWAYAGQFLVTQTFNDSGDGIDGMKFGMSAAARAQDWEEVAILEEQFDELFQAFEETDGLGYFNYPKAANLKIKSARLVRESIGRQRIKFIEKEERVLSALPEEQRLDAVTQPKWIQTADGGWQPNFANPLWETKNGKNVWKGS